MTTHVDITADCGYLPAVVHGDGTSATLAGEQRYVALLSPFNILSDVDVAAGSQT